MEYYIRLLRHARYYKAAYSKKFRLKIELEVHATTIKVLRTLIKDMKITALIEKGYREFISLANDLAEAKKQRTNAQYYTGTGFMKERFQKMSEEFLLETVNPYMERIRMLLGEGK